MYNNADNVDLERDYLPSLHSKRFQDQEKPGEYLLNHFIELTTKHTSELTSKYDIKVEADLRYGGTNDRQLVDVYYTDGTPSTAPLFVFIHGGYWQLMDKGNSGSIVLPLVRRGYRVAIMDYNLCPQVSLEELTLSMNNFFNWIFNYAEKTHTTSISFAGHSAGGHLLAQLLRAPQMTAERRQLVRSVILISGVYDLRELWPLQEINTDNNLQIDAEKAAELSPMLWEFNESTLWINTDFHVLVAGLESVTFIEQSRSFYKVLLNAGFKAHFKIFDDYDHANILEETAEENTPVTLYIQEALQ